MIRYAVLWFVTKVRVCPPRLGDLFAADDICELSIDGPDLVRGLETVSAALAQIDDAGHGEQGSRWGAAFGRPNSRLLGGSAKRRTRTDYL